MSEKKRYKVVAVNLREFQDKNAAMVKNYKKQMEIQAANYADEMTILTNDDPRRFNALMASTFILAVDESEQVIGFIAIGYHNEVKEIVASHVYVFPTFRKQGVYKMMLSRLIKFTHDVGFKSIEVGVYNQNEASLLAHRTMGFMPFAQMMRLNMPIMREDVIVDASDGGDEAVA